MIEWIIDNETWLTVLISLTSLLITTILTFCIIRQTNKVSKQQMQQQAMINKQQEELQKRQIKLDTFEYKNNIYYTLYKICQLTGEIEDSFRYVKYKEKSFEQLQGIFDIFVKTLKIDSREFIWLLKQAEYILPGNIIPITNSISTDFNELTGDFGKLGLFPKILVPDELEEEKLKLIDDVYSRCNRINSHWLFIESIMPEELSIANLSK